jgi:flagellar basal-body rod protein FlgC
MLPAIQSAISGLLTSAAQVSGAASNIANAQSTVVQPANQAPQDNNDNQSSDYTGYQPFQVVAESTPEGGVRPVAKPVDPAFIQAYQPDHPSADSQGVVKFPNVQLENEFTVMIQAQRAYEANLAVIKTSDRMLGALMDAIS